ncbi:ATP-dependent DNA helicase [Caerostris darwini]|uniref:ATP-dependent DNA helicase n=1 Tax=Caerostris darwini TaxID=1538125 RepID=A0AAV4WRF5_9ARAC|nr:ATP-dependent DNA helicase [Caerostris darwini]
MGRAKRPPDEARMWRLESARRNRQNPEVKQKIREAGGWRNAWKKLQRRIRADPPNLNPYASTIFQRGKSLELTPPNVSMKIHLSRERRAQKCQQTSNDSSPSSKQRRLDNESFAWISRQFFRPETAVGFGKGLIRVVQYVALSRVTSTAGLYILDNYTPPPPPHVDDSILQELKLLKGRSIVPKYKFLRKHCDSNTLQIMYHNVQSLNANYYDIAVDPFLMNSDILLLSETWTILRDTYGLNGFDHHHLVSDLPRQRPSCVSIYIKP